MAYDFSNYGKPAVIPTSQFTREMQENIINGHFSGAPGSVYNGLVQPKNEQVDTNQSSNNGRDDRITLSKEEYQALVNRRANDTPQYTAQPNQMNANQQQQGQQTTAPYGQTASPSPNGQTNESVIPKDDFEAMMNEALGLGDRTSNNVNQQSTQEQQQQAQVQANQNTQQQAPANATPSYEELQARQQLEQYSKEAGFTTDEVVEFASRLSIKDIVDMYKAVKVAQAQQQQQQQQQPINISEANGMKRNVPTNPFPIPRDMKSIF